MVLSFFLSLHLYLFFHVDFFALLVVEFIGEERNALVGGDVYSEAILHLPPHFHRDEPLIDVGGYIGVYMQVKPANLQCLYKVINLSFQGVGEEYRRFDGALSEAYGATLLDGDIHGGAYALACYLH